MDRNEQEIPMNTPSLHHQDFYGWTQTQIALLRKGRDAVILAARETGFDEAVFPTDSLFSLEAALNPEYWPE
jgi:hypothetical protein